MRTVGTGHLRRLTDDFGIWQHTNGPEIDYQHGYALDDSARALLAAVEYGQYDLMTIYLGFLETAVGGRETVNFFDAERSPLLKKTSEDALGEAAWALGAASQLPQFHGQAATLFHRITPKIRQLQTLRGRSYALLGALYIDPPLAARLTESLLTDAQPRSFSWVWPEKKLTYGNAILPLSLIMAGDRLAHRPAKNLGLLLLNWLNLVCRYEGYPIAIGNRGWYPEGKVKALYDQQPIDPSYQVLANAAAWQISSQAAYLGQALFYFDWFWGRNLSGQSLIDEDDSCRDALWENGVSPNRGAENVVCFLLAQAAIQRAVQASANKQWLSATPNAV